MPKPNIDTVSGTRTLNNTNILDIRYAVIHLCNDVKGEVLINYALVNNNAQEYNEDNDINYRSENSLQTSFIITAPLEKALTKRLFSMRDVASHLIW